ncbi:MAG: putative 4-hydroxybenzoate polyprenyltransferase [Bacteroidales bacterium]|nr:putative 4-hydroxybenzoate polyprenyltransferase [Bacteroidales bacterium]
MGANFIKQIRAYLSLVKFAHTVFAMPFAITGFLIGAYEQDFLIDYRVFLFIILCMVFARNTAMAFNRYTDRLFDAKNPRTNKREIPANAISSTSALVFTIINMVLFVATTRFINNICFYLSPLALLVITGYSFTKRFTALSHLVLGLGLSLAPIGAYLAVAGSFALLPVLYSFIVLFWVAGFDIIYSLQDYEFDKQEHLKSIPVVFGLRKAKIMALIFHIISVLFIIIAGKEQDAGVIYYIGTLLFLLMLLYQHIVVFTKGEKKVNAVFGLINGSSSIIFVAFNIADIFFKI